MAKVMLMSLGSRGDMEPILAKAEELLEEGHEVALCMPEQFKGLASEVSATWFGMDRAFLDLIESPEVHKITGQIGSPLSRLRTILRLMRSTKGIQQQLIRDQKRAVEAFQPHRIVFHIKCIYPAMLGATRQCDVELLSPIPCMIHPIAEEPHIGFGTPRGAWWNRLTYRFANRVMIRKNILDYGGDLAREWGMPLDHQTLSSFFLTQLPIEVATEPALFPRPEEWPSHVRMTGFRERDKAQHWTPDPALEDFLEANPRPMYVGFGSMINGRPREVGQAIVDAAEAVGVPVVLNASWGGIELEDVPPHAFLVDDVPFDWLFARVRAVVHHGGSGTTHSALRFGVPQLIVPHIADQHFWARCIQRQGLGPQGFPIKDLDRGKLEAAFKALLDMS